MTFFICYFREQIYTVLVQSKFMSLLTFLVTSCMVFNGCHIEKRVHKKGYHITWNFPSHYHIKNQSNIQAAQKKDIRDFQIDSTIKNTNTSNPENLAFQDSTVVFSKKNKNVIIAPRVIRNEILSIKSANFNKEPEPETPYDKRIKRSLYHFLIGSASFAIGLSITFTLGMVTGINAIILAISVIGGFFVGIIGLGVLLIAIRKRNWYRILAKNNATFGFTHRELQLNDPFRKFGIAVLKILLAICLIVILIALWSISIV